MKDTSTKDRVIGSSVCTPHVGAEEDGESSDEDKSLSKDEGQWHPDKVAETEGEDIIIRQERDLVDWDTEKGGIWEKQR